MPLMQELAALSRSAGSAALPCTRYSGFEVSEPIPFPGADSMFSSRCGAISRRLRFAVSLSRVAMTERDGRRLSGASRRCKLFLQAFPNLSHFSPSFSKDSFGRFVGFQGLQASKAHYDDSPNFCGSAESARRLPAAKSAGIAEGP